MFLGAGTFLALLAAYRVCWLSGRFGGGKTSLGVWIAAWLVANKYAGQIVSNMALRGATSPCPVPLVDAALLIDETWLYIDNWKDVKSYAAFLRKLNLYLIMPSVWPPHPRLRLLEVHRVFNARVIGLPVWVYRWSLSMQSIGEKGYFMLWFPERVFKFYDSLSIPKDDGGIVAALAASVGLPGEGGKYGSGQGAADSGDLSEAARRIDDYAEKLDRYERYNTRKQRR